MQKNLKPIQTRYKGYRFRSRLEARWAVFFDALGLRWEYEPEGFATDAGPYLPDFFLPELNGGTYVEVKPNHDDWDAYLPKFNSLAVGTGKSVLFACGTPDQREYLLVSPPDSYSAAPGLHGVCFNSKYLPPQLHDGDPRLYWCPGSDAEADCIHAIHAARSARFEHGERG